jgi:hypothetical protein
MQLIPLAICAFKTAQPAKMEDNLTVWCVSRIYFWLQAMMFQEISLVNLLAMMAGTEMFKRESASHAIHHA